MLSGEKETNRHKEEEKKKPKLRVPFMHVHQIVSTIGFSRLFSKSNIEKIIQRNIHQEWQPQITYKTSSPAWLRICNYSKFLKTLDRHKLENILKNKCNCDPAYIPTQLQHVVTGNLEIIRSLTLRRYMDLGTKYKQNEFKTKKDILDSCMADSINYIERLRPKAIITGTEKDRIIENLEQVIRYRISQRLQNYMGKIEMTMDDQKELKKMSLACPFRPPSSRWSSRR